MPTTSCLLDAINTHTTQADLQPVLLICHAAVLDAMIESGMREERLTDAEQATEARVLARMARSLKQHITTQTVAPQIHRQVRNVPPPETRTTPST